MIILNENVLFSYVNVDVSAPNNFTKMLPGFMPCVHHLEKSGTTTAGRLGKVAHCPGSDTQILTKCLQGQRCGTARGLCSGMASYMSAVGQQRCLFRRSAVCGIRQDMALVSVAFTQHSVFESVPVVACLHASFLFLTCSLSPTGFH